MPLQHGKNYESEKQYFFSWRANNENPKSKTNNLAIQAANTPRSLLNWLATPRVKILALGTQLLARHHLLLLLLLLQHALLDYLELQWLEASVIHN